MSELLREEVARVLRQDVQDPRVRLVTLTRVDVAPDFSNALVFWSALDAEDEEALGVVQEGLDDAAPFVRGRLARVLSLKRTPELRFRHDPSLELGTRTLALLREISNEPET
ncbi:MAG: 30S ribosome-binding factor RbfA [Myxococcota bacterium]|nr:30S ribosome-binding factor RbfA [Myxococcota bacterium]